MDYNEEQNTEVEALESIYGDELEILATEPYHNFTIKVSVQNHDPHEDDPIDLSVVLGFTYTEKYPDQAPVMEVIDCTDNLDGQQITILTDLLQDQAEENLGMVMIFTLISAVQERLNLMVDEMKQFRIDEADRKKREDEEAEMKRFEGTRVTIETFLTWKTKFEAEMSSLKKNVKAGDRRPTGRELFMNDASLDDSDVKFLQEVGETVEIDESLFEDLEDLDIEDE